MQGMGEAVVDDRLDPRIADQHLIEALGRRIAPVGGIQVGVEQGADAGQLVREAAGDLRGLAMRLDAVAFAIRGTGRQFDADLLPERQQ
jgi:hypothetical protein